MNWLWWSFKDYIPWKLAKSQRSINNTCYLYICIWNLKSQNRKCNKHMFIFAGFCCFFLFSVFGMCLSRFAMKLPRARANLSELRRSCMSDEVPYVVKVEENWDLCQTISSFSIFFLWFLVIVFVFWICN